MTLPETIYAHARVLPAELQRETLDFIEYLERRYRVANAPVAMLDTEGFLARFAGCLGDDFPDDVDAIGLAPDSPRERLE